VSGQFFPQALESSHTFRAQSLVIRTQEADNMRILRDSIDTADSISEKKSIPRHFDAHRCTLAKLSTAIGCNKDAGSSLQMYIARFFQYCRLVFQRNSRFQDTSRCTGHVSEANRLS
jgi:hypothetical protein